MCMHIAITSLSMQILIVLTIWYNDKCCAAWREADFRNMYMCYQVFKPDNWFLLGVVLCSFVLLNSRQLRELNHADHKL